MILSKHARRYYQLEIVTQPQLADWEGSFDHGKTWRPGLPVDELPNYWRWLLVGTEAQEVDESEQVVPVSVWPLIRSASANQITVDQVPPVNVY